MGNTERGLGFPDLLDYNATVAPGVQMLTSGMFLAAWRLRGPDAEAMSIHDSAALMAKIGESFRLGAGWTVQSDQFQHEVCGYPSVDEWQSPVAQLIDRERERLFTSTGADARYRGDFYLTISYKPVRKKGDKGIGWMFGEDGNGHASADLRLFERKVDEIDRVLRRELMISPGTFVERLGYSTSGHQKFDDLSRFIRRCITQEDFPFAAPSQDYLIHQLFGREFLGGQQPKLHGIIDGRYTVAGKHIYPLMIHKFPDRPGTGTYPGVMGILEALPFRFRFVQQGRCVTEMEAKRIYEKEAARLEVVKQSIFSSGNAAPISGNAQELQAQAKQAADDAEFGKKYYVRYKALVVLMDSSMAILDEQARLVKEVVQSRGFDVTLETRNAVRTFISSLPGHAEAETRQFIATVGNMACMAQLSAPYTGMESNPSSFLPQGTPPLFVGCTLGRVPFNYHPHVTSDGVGHTAIIGPSGTGKTTLESLMIASHGRLHPDAQTFVFDKEYAQHTLVTALGGDYYSMTSGECSFAPLQRLQTTNDHEWAFNYVSLLCSLNNHGPDADEQTAITNALNTMAMSGNRDRSLTQFQAYVGPQAPAIAEALQIYTIGAAGGILDAQEDNLTLGNLAAFEMGSIYKMSPTVAGAVLAYIFHRIEERLDPRRPTLIAIDEFRQALDHPMMVKQFAHLLEQGRKLNGWCVIAIQELQKIVDSPLANTIARECLTTICLPNKAAKYGERAAYDRFDITDQDAECIASGTRHQDYYVKSPQTRRYITLELGKLALALMKSSDEDRAEITHLRRLYPNDWVAHWLKRCGLPEWAQELRELQRKERSVYAVA